MIGSWFTVAAQIVNFLILVWLLKRFLYKPVLNAIDEREKGIAARLAAAAAKEAAARKDGETFRQKSETLDKERQALIGKAVAEANAERQRLLDGARTEADALRAKRQASLLNDKRKLEHEVVRWTQAEVFAIARKTLMDLADTSLEERVSSAFVGRLRGLSKGAKDQVTAAFVAQSHTGVIRSAMNLAPTERMAIESAVRETFDARIQIEFQTAPELIGGIELIANGHKVAWNIADYLTTLEKSAAQFLREAP